MKRNYYIFTLILALFSTMIVTFACRKMKSGSSEPILSSDSRLASIAVPGKEVAFYYPANVLAEGGQIEYRTDETNLTQADFQIIPESEKANVNWTHFDAAGTSSFQIISEDQTKTLEFSLVNLGILSDRVGLSVLEIKPNNPSRIRFFELLQQPIDRFASSTTQDNIPLDAYADDYPTDTDFLLEHINPYADKNLIQVSRLVDGRCKITVQSADKKNTHTYYITSKLTIAGVPKYKTRNPTGGNGTISRPYKFSAQEEYADLNLVAWSIGDGSKIEEVTAQGTEGELRNKIIIKAIPEAGDRFKQDIHCEYKQSNP